MTPKEKAFELYSKYNNLIVDEVIEMKIAYLLMSNKMAKQCALIAVDELIEVACDYSDDDETVTKEYWKKVKIEINNL